MFPLSNDDDDDDDEDKDDEDDDDDDDDDDEEEEDVSTFQCPFHRIPLNSGLWEKGWRRSREVQDRLTGRSLFTIKSTRPT